MLFATSKKCIRNIHCGRQKSAWHKTIWFIFWRRGEASQWWSTRRKMQLMKKWGAGGKIFSQRTAWSWWPVIWRRYGAPKEPLRELGQDWVCKRQPLEFPFSQEPKRSCWTLQAIGKSCTQACHRYSWKNDPKTETLWLSHRFKVVRDLRPCQRHGRFLRTNVRQVPIRAAALVPAVRKRRRSKKSEKVYVCHFSKNHWSKLKPKFLFSMVRPATRQHAFCIFQKMHP